MQAHSPVPASIQGESHSRFFYVLIAVGVLLLLSMLAYPFGYDQAAFSVGGDLILKHGAIPYRDFLDTKPPIIFYLYSLALGVFGHHVWSIRALDVLWQAATFYCFYRLVRRYTSSNILALLTSFIPLLQYTASGYWMTAQAETFAFLSMVGITGLALKERSGVKEGILIGVLCAVLFLLKFTLAIALVGVIAFALLRRRSESLGNRLNVPIASTLTFALLAAAYLLHLKLVGGLDRFFESLTWVSNYASLNPLFSRETMSKQYFQLFPRVLVFVLTPTLAIAAVLGIRRFMLAESSNERSYIPAFNRDFLEFSGVQLALGLLAVLYERKYFPYHYSRVYLFWAPFIVLGLGGSWRFIRARWKHPLACLLFVPVVFFSPMSQVISQCIQWPLAAISGKNIGKEVERRTPEYFYAEQLEVGARVKSLLANAQHQGLFFWGNDVGTYFFADQVPSTICLTNTPFITDWTPQSWRSEVLGKLTSNPPHVVVIESGDARDYISGTTLDSREQLLRWTELNSWLTSHYQKDTTIGHFDLYTLLKGTSTH